MDMDLSGKKALVTGSTRGIGLATAIGLADMGATVVLHGRTEASLSKGMERARAQRPHCRFEGMAGDLALAADCDALAATHPTVDVLVNNVGIYEMKPFGEIPDAEWEHYFQVNVMSGVRLSRHYLPGMIERDWGRIVFVSSESGAFIPKEMIHYGMTKTAQLAVARGLAETTVGTGVTVNSVLPGPTWVETQEERISKRVADEGRSFDDLKADIFKTRRQTSLLRRYATAEEVASMICYACSPAASATNGAPLRVEGGIVRSVL